MGRKNWHLYKKDIPLENEARSVSDGVSCNVITARTHNFSLEIEKTVSGLGSFTSA
ncbi:hypothetical protein ACFP1I_12245 [Dyadobacter subterraneus]|uniref:Uncharacterized protein n=1 Tax=Dyadobacter subterraneus TaxID=2773304 RepID=A0ABR9W939_9BACT|nr:hypothetical protein [Dyadobacter subterraneus]MBE9462000.1 hypothetical protein [Dyadobacter subterraneus]